MEDLGSKGKSQKLVLMAEVGTELELKDMIHSPPLS